MGEKCSDSKVSDKTIFSTFARTLPPSSKVSKSLISLLKHFMWDQLMLLVSDSSSDKQVAEALIQLAQEHEIEILEIFYIPGDYLTKHNTTLKDIIMETYERTRVYVVIADIYALVDFVRIMQKEGLFDKGEYIVISLDEDEVYDPYKKHQYIRREFEAASMVADPIPFRSVLLLSPGSPIHPDYEFFKDLVLNYSESEPFNIPFHHIIKVEVPIYAGLAYDAVMIYASALTEALADNRSELEGTAIFQYIKSRPYESIMGFSVMIDDNGDAEGNYSVMALVKEGEPPQQKMMPVARFTHQGTKDLPLLRIERAINWIAGAPPLSEPRCGFKGEKCDNKPEWKMALIYAVCCAVTIILGAILIRHYRYEQKLACLLWKVEMKDLLLLRSDHDGRFQRFRNTLYVSIISFIREMRHENINPFIGACVDPPNICILSLFCSRGSLQDILNNPDLHLDTMFIASLVADLVKGMIYIHESDIISHGNLKSSNCIVDNRWMLKITDFGMHEFRANQDPPPEVKDIRSRSLLWRAPELMRKLNPPARGTQKGDVYSFGIILFEIIGRKGPWGNPEPSLKYVEERVANPMNYDGELFRPPLHELDCPDYIKQCMEECWFENPEDRPDFRFIKVKLRVLHSGLYVIF
ncbi:guanylate cyclase 32E-like [Stegodyphus dumicola]|uniref:guanylate cyclase 32E-like n=1 Tax=Stegodyphus dumicola TaxID=202533 RepID=UPI0015AFB74E|nr:guanylate cyclase 32E-like [Stegodyphus dumicola]